VRVAGIRPVREQRLPAIQRLQQHELRDIGDAAAAGLRQPRRVAFAALLHHAQQFGDEVHQRRRGGEPQHGGHEAFVHHDAPIRLHLGDPRERQAGEAGAFLSLQQKAQAWPGHLELGGERAVRMRVEGFEAPQCEACGGVAWPVAERDFRAAGLPHGRRQIDDGVAGAVRNVDRWRLIGGVRDGEDGAILQHAGRRGERELTSGQQVAIQRKLRQAPGERP